MKIFGREMAVWLATIAAVFQVVTSFGFDRDGHFQGIAAAIVVFVFGVITAIRSGDGIIAMATGVVTALFSLFAAFNLEWSAERQGYVIGAITLILGFWVRDRVTSPTPASVSPPGKLVV
jgi:intracellular septation protein A